MRVWIVVIALLLAIARPAGAQQQLSASASVTERLITLLVEKGVLTRDQAGALLQQAKQEAETARKPAPRPRPATPAFAVAKQPAAALSTPAQAAQAEPQLPPGTVRVTYVPQIVRDQIAQEVRNQMLQEAPAQATAASASSAVPEWVRRITVFGDFRFRGEGDFFPSSNRGTPGNFTHFPDYQAINTGSAFDTLGGAFPPLLDTTADRTRVRLRARLGVDAKIDDGISSEIRIATGNDNAPYTANQTLGQNGPFTKYSLWLDRAFVKAAPTNWVSINVGRQPNPYWTTNLQYYDELSFDGLSATLAPKVNGHIDGFVTAGGFPIFNTAFNFATTQAPKEPSHNAWLLAAQAGGQWRFSDNYAFKLAAGYFDYVNTQGKLSAPCTIVFASDSCSTDDTRPLIWQFGNTMFPIRNIVCQPGQTTCANPQYFGLASRFGILDVHGRFEIDTFKPVVIGLEGDFVWNLGFNREQVLAEGPTGDNFNGTAYKGGNKGYMGRITAGTPTIEQRWDWNVSLAYKYIESDAVLSALVDNDFHLGGTNAKGYVLEGYLGVARNAYLGLHWLSASEIVGQPYRADVLQADLNVKF